MQRQASFCSRLVVSSRRIMSRQLLMGGSPRSFFPQALLACSFRESLPEAAGSLHADFLFVPSFVLAFVVVW